MGLIGEYLIGVTAAAILCAVVARLTGKHASGAVTRMVCGLFLTLAVIAPWTKLRLDSLSDLKIDIDSSVNQVVDEGKYQADTQVRRIISERTRAYILDKAESLGATLTVTVTLTDDALPVPRSVEISGSVSPYAKKVLSQSISQDLGIRTEEQIWNC